jgi:hypothetical protein
MAGVTQPVEYRVPPWVGPPQNVLPATVALDVVLARTPDAAVWLSDVRALPDGVRLRLTFATRRPRDEHEDDPVWGPEPAELSVVLADGRRAAMTRGEAETDEPAAGVVLYAGSGDTTPTRTTASVWLWPLPPDGPLTFVVGWPAGGIGETAVAVDAAPIRAAARRAVVLWEDERPLLPPAPKDRRGFWSAAV